MGADVSRCARQWATELEWVPSRLGDGWAGLRSVGGENLLSVLDREQDAQLCQLQGDLERRSNYRLTAADGVAIDRLTAFDYD